MHMHTFSTVLIFSNRRQVLQHKQTCNILQLISFFFYYFLKGREKVELFGHQGEEKPGLPLDIYCK